MQSEFEGKVVMVNGAVRCIGLSTAEMFAGKGASMIVTDLDTKIEEIDAILRTRGASDVLAS